MSELQVADFVHLVQVLGVGAERDLHARLEDAVHDADAGDGAAIPVVVRVENEGAQRRFAIAPRSRHTLHHGLEQLGDADPLLGGDAQDLVGLGAQQVVDLLGAPVGLGAGKVDLVETG